MAAHRSGQCLTSCRSWAPPTQDKPGNSARRARRAWGGLKGVRGGGRRDESSLSSRCQRRAPLSAEWRHESVSCRGKIVCEREGGKGSTDDLGRHCCRSLLRPFSRLQAYEGSCRCETAAV